MRQKHCATKAGDLRRLLRLDTALHVSHYRFGFQASPIAFDSILLSLTNSIARITIWLLVYHDTLKPDKCVQTS